MKTKNYLFKPTVLVFFAFFALFQINAQIHQPLLQIPATTAPPVIDGKLNDVAWQKSAELSEFVNWSLDSYAKDSVTVFVCYDAKNLYVAFRNSDKNATSLSKTVEAKRHKDSFQWGRDFDMISVDYKGVSIQLQADPKETVTDFKNWNIALNANWQYAASINTSDWTSEFSMPLSEFGLSELPDNKEISVSFQRSFPGGESCNWSGKCSLTSKTNANVQYGRWLEPIAGKNNIAFKANNFGTESLNVICELELTPLNEKPEFINQAGQGPSSNFQIKTSSETARYKASYTIPAGGKIAESIPYELTVEGSYLASATVKLSDGTILRRSVDYWFTIEPNRKKLKLLKNQIGESIAAMTRLSNPEVNNLKIDANNLLLTIQKLDSYADTAWKIDEWNELTMQVDKTDKQVARHLHQVRWYALHNWKNSDDFGVSFTHSILKLRKDEMFPQPINDHIDISLARNEYESFQLAILPFGKDLNQISLEVTDLTGSDGSVIPKSNISLSMVDYNYIDWQAQYVTAYKGWHPDPLIPYKVGGKIDGNELCRPVWITVYAPLGTKSGNYSGTFTISAEGMKKVTAKVNCQVWDFDLPKESNLKTHSWDVIENLADFYNLKEFPADKYLQFCDLLLKNRFNPGSVGVNFVSQVPNSKGEYDFSKVEKVLSYCLERGLSRFSIIQMKKGFYTPEEEVLTYKFISAYAKFLRKKGWIDKALVELWDEPTDIEWPYVKDRAEKTKKIDPGLRLQLFAERGPYDFWDTNTDKYGLNKLVDIWSPANIIESPETQAKGGEIWTYFCTLARDNAPNLYIDCPAIYQRSIAWYCWMYGVDGFEHWGWNYFWRNTQKGMPMDKKWPNVPWDSRTYHYFNGEGQLLYPGPDGVPYSSIRLENFRDGMDDYEYLFKLRELLSKYDNDTTNSELNDYRQLLIPENYLLYKYPRKIKVTLENTIRYPEQPELILNTREKIAKAIEKLQKKQLKK